MKLTKSKLQEIIKEEFEKVVNEASPCTVPEVQAAMDVITRCAFKSTFQRPTSASELGVMPKSVSVPPAGVESGGVKWIPEDKKNKKKKKPSAGLSKKKKSDVAKKARKGKDIGKKGKNFDKVAQKAAKEYGSEEAGKKVAAAAMWNNMKR